jgi:hypothetical protein
MSEEAKQTNKVSEHADLLYKYIAGSTCKHGFKLMLE